MSQTLSVEDLDDLLLEIQESHENNKIISNLKVLQGFNNARYVRPRAVYTPGASSYVNFEPVSSQEFFRPRKKYYSPLERGLSCDYLEVGDY